LGGARGRIAVGRHAPDAGVGRGRRRLIAALTAQNRDAALLGVHRPTGAHGEDQHQGGNVYFHARNVDRGDRFVVP